MRAAQEGRNMRATYENFYATCPRCSRENIFNRASDLKDRQPIDFREVVCLFAECSKPFVINGDIVSPAYQMLIMDCYELIPKKHYAYCILNLAQAYELFFSQYLRVHFLYRPAAAEFDEGNFDLDRLNRLRRLLYETTKRLTFSHLRDLFVNSVLRPSGPSSLRESEHAIRRLPKECEKFDWADLENGALTDKALKDLLVGVRSPRTTELRNDVVHKLAYRPTLEQVNDCLKETKGILFGLAGRLGVHFDDIEAYRKRHVSAATPSS
jgi:hypothetical protein